jgi:hypothetical protein
MRKLYILRRQGGIAKHFDLRAGVTTVIVYADHVEPPLARRRHPPQIIAHYLRYLPSLMSIDRSFGRFNVARCTGFHFDKTQHISFPPDHIDFTTVLRRTIIPGNHCVSNVSQEKVSIFLTANADAQVYRHPRRRKDALGAPIQRPDDSTRHNSKHHTKTE